MTSNLAALDRSIAHHILDHLLERITHTPAIDEPFSHLYVEDVFPADVYERLLDFLPAPRLYKLAAERHYGNQSEHVRSMFALTQGNLAHLSPQKQELWQAVAAALTAPELKRAVYTKLARDLAFRYGIPEARVGELIGYTRPTLYRETAGFEIPPHPDTRKKIVTMHLYLPADRSQLDLGTALYRRRLLAWPLGKWQQRFVKAKQFPFQPNSGYAFVVNNSFLRKSWHGRETLPDNAGVRNTLLNTFYEEQRPEFAWE